MDMESYLQNRSKSFIFVLGLLLNCVIGYADNVTGQQIGVGAFYLMPVFLVTWFINGKTGVVMSFISASTIVVSNLPGYYEHTAIELWNTFMHLCFFVIFTILLARIRRTLEERSSLIEKLQRSYDDMETFTHAASHDLRSPLIAIDGFSRIIQRDYADKLDEDGRDLLNRIRSGAQKMAQLIEDLLSFSRISTKEIRRLEIDMEELAGRVFEELRPAMGDRIIRMDIRRMPRAYGDLSMIQQVLVNFLTNAIKFTRMQKAPVIEVGGREEGRENIYYVRDNGMGFDQKFSDKLFSIFQRVHTSSEIEGTGVGLFIVRQVIEKHGGRVWAEGEPEKGATFYFTLPRSDAGGLFRLKQR